MPSSLLARLLADIRSCDRCGKALPLGPRPLLAASSQAKLLLVSQAPGRHAHLLAKPFADASGDRLRQWLGLSEGAFYDAAKVAIMPMAFCYPGRDPAGRGGDAPPPALCSGLWHGRILRHLPQIELTLLIGGFAQRAYLPAAAASVTEAVRDWRRALPRFLPLPHPTWRNNGWLRKNPWFEAELVPELRLRVSALLDSAPRS